MSAQEGAGMDVHAKLDELSDLVNEARSMPMSASCIVNRSEVLSLLDEVRELLPEELHHAEALLEDREAVVEDGRREADRLVADAEQEQARLVSEQEVVAVAQQRAAEIVAEARALSQRMRRETDDYVDGKLAGFEVVLGKTLAAVTRGREKLATRVEDVPDEDEGLLAGAAGAPGGSAEGEYVEGDYVEPGYVEPGYVEPGYPEPGYSDTGYERGGYSDGGHRDGGSARWADDVEPQPPIR